MGSGYASPSPVAQSWEFTEVQRILAKSNWDKDQVSVLDYIKTLQNGIQSILQPWIFEFAPVFNPTLVTLPPMVDWDINFDIVYQWLLDLMNRIPDDPVFLDVDQTIVTMDPLKPITDIANIPIPEFTAEMSDPNFGDSPVWEDFGEIEESPTVVTYATPDKPSYTMPTEPILSSVVLPSPISLDIPVFDETLLDEDLITPTNNFSFVEQDYTSALKDLVVTKLSDEITNGGYGLDTTDEQLLFDREREREARAATAIITDSIKNFSSLGFVLPQGALLKTIKQANGEFLNKTSSVNRDIALKRADLYMQGKQFVIDKAIGFETVFINLYNSKMERELNAAKAMVQVAIDIFNAEVMRYKAKQERYIALVEVFKARIQGELAKVEIYKAQMDGAKTEVSVNESLVDLYKAKMEAVQTIMEIYKTDASVFEILNNVEKIKFDIFRAQIDAYIAKVQSKKIEFDAYDSHVKGELGKVEVYKAEAQAYSAVIDGKKAAVDVEKTKLESYIAQNKGIIEAFLGQVEQYKSIREMQGSYNKDQADIFKARADIFNTEAEAIGKIIEEDIAVKDATLKYMSLEVQTNIEIAKLQLEQALKVSEFYLEFDKSKIDFYRSYMASVMSIINFNGSLSASGSGSTSASTSTSDSYSDTISENTNNNIASGTVTYNNHSWDETKGTPSG
jgi:hypothetical protein